MSANYDYLKLKEWRKTKARRVDFYLAPNDLELVLRARQNLIDEKQLGGGEDPDKVLPLTQFFREAMFRFIEFYNLDY